MCFQMYDIKLCTRLQIDLATHLCNAEFERTMEPAEDSNTTLDPSSNGKVSDNLIGNDQF